MNKLERNLLKKTHFIKRIKYYAACTDQQWTALMGEKYLQNLRNTGTPCSCFLCKGGRYGKRDRSLERQLINQELLEAA